jgi:hypothetical protein
MIRLIEMVLTFLMVLVGSVVFGAIGIGLWITSGLVGLAALAVFGSAIALAWVAAARVGDAARRQAARQVQQQSERQKRRREPRLAVPRQSRHGHGCADTCDEAIIVEWTVVPTPTKPEPQLFRDADDFSVIQWTEDRRR